jgi:hypothetical protein
MFPAMAPLEVWAVASAAVKLTANKAGNNHRQGEVAPLTILASPKHCSEFRVIFLLSRKRFHPKAETCFHCGIYRPSNGEKTLTPLQLRCQEIGDGHHIPNLPGNCGILITQVVSTTSVDSPVSFKTRKTPSARRFRSCLGDQESLPSEIARMIARMQLVTKGLFATAKTPSIPMQSTQTRFS